jgi:hypothetical protein
VASRLYIIFPDRRANESRMAPAISPIKAPTHISKELGRGIGVILDRSFFVCLRGTCGSLEVTIGPCQAYGAHSPSLFFGGLPNFGRAGISRFGKGTTSIRTFIAANSFNSRPS